ncbi:hypothetical protein GF345_06845 [Candidatus Woesearchaeota archaeon]|nr:hypothetical protein [Candidatus Woesearchaeota archaeon]
MIRFISKIFRKSTGYMEWESYKRKIDFLSDFWFQQDVRVHNARTS